MSVLEISMSKPYLVCPRAAKSLSFQSTVFLDSFLLCFLSDILRPSHGLDWELEGTNCPDKPFWKVKMFSLIVQFQERT